MIGGLLKSTSRVALFAAAGMFVGGVAMPSAKAADLGGDCCADLEERVAELEATTARKGNRKMSLTITGQVNRLVLWYDDGFSSKTYYGVDNTNSSTRFSFLGSAKVTPKVSMGFEIMIEVAVGAVSARLDQTSEDGNGSTNTAANSQHFNQPNGSSDFLLGGRRAAAWVEHADLGRVTVGRFESAGVVNTIDLGGISVIASSSFGLLNGNFKLRDSSSRQLSSMSWSNMVDPAANQGRTELVRYDSPSWHGFIYSASIAEAGDYWGSMLRYANEFNGVRVAAGLGIEIARDRVTGVPVDPLGTNSQINDNTPSPDTQAWGFALSAMHVPSGFFVQGHYQHVSYSQDRTLNGVGVINSAYWGDGGPAAPYCASAANGGFFDAGGPALTDPCTNPGNKKDAYQWLIQAGISKNFFGPGNTSLYGEYGRAIDWGATTLGRDYGNYSVNSNPFYASGPGSTNFFGVKNVTHTEMSTIGAGIVQVFDSAATEIFLGWRRMDPEVTSNLVANGVRVVNVGTPANNVPNPTACGANNPGPAPSCVGVAQTFNPMAIDVITAGIRVKF